MRLAALAAFTAAALPAAHAQSFGFDCITNNTAGNCTSGESQLGMTFADAGSGRVSFTFTNTGATAMSITDVYWAWSGAAPSLSTSGASIADSGAGVSFSFGASPSDLPGGNTVGFSADLGADSNSPTQPNGVNPGEWVRFTFNGTFAALSAALTAGTFDVGIHVQGFSNGGSEAFVSTAPVPEPGKST
jgi:hypothetical protein